MLILGMILEHLSYLLLGLLGFLNEIGVNSFEKTCQKTGLNYNFLLLEP